MSDEKKKKSTSERVQDAQSSWEASSWRSPVRQMFYELVFSYALGLSWGIPLGAGSSFLGLLATGFVWASLGAVLALGIGVVGNPLTILALAGIHLIDGDLKEEDSKGWFFGKSVIKALVSGGGGALAGVSLFCLFGPAASAHALFAPYMPAQTLLMTGTQFATGITVWFIVSFYYHTHIFMAIHTDDGYGMILLAGLAQFVLGFLTFAIWQVVPNLNYLFTIVVAANQWNNFAWFDLGIEVGAVLATLLLYYLLLRDVFSRNARVAQAEKNFEDEASLLLDRSAADGGAMRSAKKAHNW